MARLRGILCHPECADVEGQESCRATSAYASRKGHSEEIVPDEVGGTDVLVVGGGLSGLCTALPAALEGHTVTVLESAELLGGAAAYSGGMVWIPGNHLQLATGAEDSADE